MPLYVNRRAVGRPPVHATGRAVVGGADPLRTAAESFTSHLIAVLAVFIFIFAAGGRCGAADGKTQSKKPARGDFLDTLFWAPEIVVEANRISPEIDITNRSGFVGLISLENNNLALLDAAAILSRTVGVRVKQYGGMGNFATMSIRGSSSTQVQLYLDGVPLNDPYSGMANLADLSLDGMKRIEIYRGFSPAGFGSSAIGGTVNLVSYDSGFFDRCHEGGIASSRAGLETSIAGGSFGTRRYLLSARARRWKLFASGRASFAESEGDFAFRDDNATPENPYDDEISERINNDFSRWNAAGRVRFDLPHFDDLSFHYDYLDREGGVPGLAANQSEFARTRRDRRIAYLKIEPAPLVSSRVHLKATAYRSSTRERFSDSHGDISLSKQQTDNRIISEGASANVRFYPFVLPASIDLMLEGTGERFRPVDLLPQRREGPERKRRSATLAISADYSLARERLVLTAGHRSHWLQNEFYDEPVMPWLPPTPQGKVDEHLQSPNFGFRFRPCSFLTLKGNIGSYHRLPTFFELFGNLGNVTGDSGLSPEKGLNRDAGLIVSAERFWKIERFFIEAVYLFNEIDDLILFFPNSQSTVQPKNIGSARIRGFEISFSGSLNNRLTLLGNYSWLDGRDTGPIPYYHGNELAGRPRHEAAATVEYSGRGWRASWELHYIGANFLDRANMKRVPARGLHDLALSIEIPYFKSTLTLEGCNLGDDRTSDVQGFPLPGRSFYTAIRFKI